MWPHPVSQESTGVPSPHVSEEWFCPLHLSSQGTSRKVGTRGGLGLVLVRGSSSPHSQQGLLSAEVSICLPEAMSTSVLGSRPICWCFSLFQEEMGISCELLESDFLKCSVGFPFMRSKSKVRGGVGHFLGSSRQTLPLAPDSGQLPPPRFPPAGAGVW